MVVIHVCLYVVMEDKEKETGTTKVCKPGSWMHCS